jgi:uncharacterized Zn finger protein (UPF0148 family)
MQHCPQCKKILFRKRDGRLVCPNDCEQSGKRVAFNTVIDPLKDRRANEDRDPWRDVKF